MPDPSEQTTGRPNREEATHLASELLEARETIRTLNDSYREAVGVPPSEHQARRLEDMAQRLEDALTEVEHLRHVISAAADDIEHWGAYAGEHFQKKWDLNGDIKRYRTLAWEPTLDLIEEFHEPSGDDPPHCLIDGQAHPCAAVRLARRKGSEG